MELLAVITIIGLFVALAMPGMSGIMQDRQAAHAADEIANLFRIARTRAAATGSAHYIQAVADGTTVNFTMRNTVIAGGVPASSCTSPSWTNMDTQVLKRIDLGVVATGQFGGKNILVRPASPGGGKAAVATTSEYCFTPGGMPYWRPGGGVWERPKGAAVAMFEVFRQEGSTQLGLTRTVRISPAGLPSIEAS